MWLSLCLLSCSWEILKTRTRTPLTHLFADVTVISENPGPRNLNVSIIRQSQKSVYVQADEAEKTRVALVNVIEDAWFNIVKFVPKQVLVLCEGELKAATSLLVLATVKYAAESDWESRIGVDDMFRAADRNGDGQLSFIEWYEWLRVSPTTTATTKTVTVNSPKDEPSSYTSSPHSQYTIALVSSLKHVLSFSSSALNVATRVSNDPAHLVAAFVSGGMATGYVATQLHDALLNRLRPEVRQLARLALALESTSVSFLSSGRRSVPPSSSFRLPRMGMDVSAMSVETVDLTAIPLVQAPDIYGPVEIETATTTTTATATTDSPSISSSPSWPSSSSLAKIEVEDNVGSNDGYEIIPLSMDTDTDTGFSSSNTNTYSWDKDNIDRDNDRDSDRDRDPDLSELLSQANNVSKELQDLRDSVRDLDDDKAKLLRQLLLSRGGNRREVWGLAMAIRAARLGNSNALPFALRQTLALDTLQLWAPLSFQFGLASEAPELEVQSYIMLYP
eukprot:gene11101-23203_t